MTISLLILSCLSSTSVKFSKNSCMFLMFCKSSRNSIFGFSPGFTIVCLSQTDVKNPLYRRIFWTYNRRDGEWMKIRRIDGFQTSRVSRVASCILSNTFCFSGYSFSINCQLCNQIFVAIWAVFSVSHYCYYYPIYFLIKWCMLRRQNICHDQRYSRGSLVPAGTPQPTCWDSMLCASTWPTRIP